MYKLEINQLVRKNQSQQKVYIALSGRERKLAKVCEREREKAKTRGEETKMRYGGGKGERGRRKVRQQEGKEERESKRGGKARERELDHKGQKSFC